MADPNPAWEPRTRADEGGGFSLVIRGGRWLIGGVMVGSAIWIWSGHFRDSGFPRWIAISVTTIGLVIGFQYVLFGAIKLRNDATHPPDDPSRGSDLT